MIQHVTKFIEDVYGPQQSFELKGGDEVIRSEGRRSEDVTTARTFLEQKANQIVFAVNIRDLGSDDMSQGLPIVFTNPEYPKVLRNRYRELNRTEIKHWKIDYHYLRNKGAEGKRSEIAFNFTVVYGG